MSELNNYSASFDPNLRFEDFSREFLLELIKNWQWAWMHLDHAFFEQFIVRNELEDAFEMDMAMWLRVATRVNPVFAEIAGIPILQWRFAMPPGGKRHREYSADTRRRRASR